jgi:Na+-driven multidrug efflux pump
VSSLFSDDSQVTELIWIYLVLVPFSYGFQGVMALLVSAFNAMHKPIEAFKWSAMRLFIFTLPLAALGNWIFDIEGMFVGIALGNFFGGVVAYMSAIKLRDEHGFDALTKSFPSADDKKL